MTVPARPAVPAAVLALLLALLSGCDEGRSPGVVVTSDGRMLDNNAANTRLICTDHIDQALSAHCDAHWKPYTSIDPLPVWDEGRGGEDGDWVWPHAQVAVHLIGDGQSAAPLTEADIHDGVFDYMKSRVHHPSTDLEVQVEIAVDAKRFAKLGPPPAAGTPGAIPAPTINHDLTAAAAAPTGAGQDYVIQAGDTWAELAVAFCGGAAHWRELAEANHWQGQPPRPGAFLVVPAAGGSVAPAPPPPPAPPVVAPPAPSPAAPPAPAAQPEPSPTGAAPAEPPPSSAPAVAPALPAGH